MPLSPSDARVVAATRSWVDRVVVGLNLCPFAKAVQAKGQVRYAVSHAETKPTLLADLERELGSLSAADPETVDTTLLIHPKLLQEFLEYNEFLSVADELLVELGLEGKLQIASFHPEYRFADAEPNDPANYTNRSPYPTLHLLREASVTRAVESFPDAASIYTRNIETLRSLEPARLNALLARDI